MPGRATRQRASLASVVVTALTALTGLAALGPVASADVPAAPVPPPGAPHRGAVASRTYEPGQDAGRDRAVRAFAEGRRAESAHSPARTPGTAQITHTRWGLSPRLTHTRWGLSPRPGTHDGLMATHSVAPDHRVFDSETFTYAPTIKAQNSCVEVVTSYWDSGSEIWAWDWCGTGGPARILTIDADFLATYTTTASGRPAYSVQLVRDEAAANHWSSYLYNHRTGSWDLLFRQSGRDRSGLDHGWDVFESYTTANPATGVDARCAEARHAVFDSSGVLLRDQDTWKPATPANSPSAEPNSRGRDSLCPSPKFLRTGADDHWTVRQ